MCHACFRDKMISEQPYSSCLCIWILKCQGGLTLGNLDLKARIQKSFLPIHIFTISGIFHSLCRSESPGIIFFFSLERTSLNISYSASLMVTNSTTSCLSGEHFYFAFVF